MLLMFSRGFKDIITKTAKFKEFPGLENKFQNSGGFKENEDTWEPCIIRAWLMDLLALTRVLASSFILSMLNNSFH